MVAGVVITCDIYDVIGGRGRHM